MKVDQQLSLDLGGNHFRIVFSDPDISNVLRGALAGHLFDGDALLGFKLELSDSHKSVPGGAQRPANGAGLSLLMDCTGAVLARSRDRDAVLAALMSHLAALDLAPPSSPISRYRMRALTGTNHAVIVAEPLFTAFPVIERRLAMVGYRLVDAPFVDLDTESLVLQPFDIPWPAMAGFEAGSGHAPPHELNVPVTHLLWPTIETSNPTRAQVCSIIAAACVSGSREQRLIAADRLAQQVRVLPVSVSNDAAPYEVLRAIGS